MADELPYVFGVGFPKTGTVSLRQAAKILGYKQEEIAIRNEGESPEEWQSRTRTHIERNLSAQVPGGRKKVLDGLPIRFSTDITHDLFRQLGRDYPDAKFIITYRDPHEIALSAWRHAARKVREGRPASPENFISYRRILAAATEHYDEVLRWALLPDNFHRTLVLRVCDGEGWEKLCPFLGFPVPSEPFPHAHNHETA